MEEEEEEGLLSRQETVNDLVPTQASESASPPSVLGELLAAGLTLDELRAIAEVGDDPNSPEMIKSWFESKKEVALSLARANLAGVVAAFVGDATVIASAHGIFAGGPETAAVLGTTGLMGACSISAAYYLHKVRMLANKSLRIQHLLHRRRRL